MSTPKKRGPKLKPPLEPQAAAELIQRKRELNRKSQAICRKNKALKADAAKRPPDADFRESLEAEITPLMLEWGIRAIILELPAAQMVRRIYVAMRAKAPEFL